MSPTWWILLGCALVAAASTLVKRRRIAELREWRDSDFLTAYNRRFIDSSESVLEMRNTISRILGVPSRKLAPDMTFVSLSKYMGFTTDYELGMSELGDELSYLRNEAGLANTIGFPETVGELIHEIIKVKETNHR